ncbi:MAG: hypothetical protein NWE80_00045 [Candidatus Bathyarchaeota archaeon]|nr:hypothetical protein [Candidatus Bathyarchaeota archaeon]
MAEKTLMPQRTMLFLLVYHVLMGLLAIYILFSIWPGAASIEESRTIPLFLGLFSLNLNAELTMILIVISAGAIGAFIQSLGSIAFHRAKKDLTEEWAAWYVTRPLIGAGLALAIYLVLRAGFIGVGTDASSINIFGTAAIAAISGMFTDKATTKLKEVANTILKSE